MPGWATTAELAGPRLGDALRTCGASLGTDRPDIQGQRLVEVVAWLLSVPIAKARVDGTPAPDLRPDNVLLWIADAPPEGDGLKLRDPGAAHPADRVLSAHLAPLIDAVNAATRRPRSALWRAAKDRADGAIAWIAEAGGRPERAFELLGDEAELRLLDLGTRRLLVHVRAGCCLYWRTPAAAKCLGCPLLDDEARRRLATE